MKPPPSLQEIAEAARVSRSTASRALRNSALISEKTRTHVRAVADELGYRSDPLVSTLMARLREGRPRGEQPIIGYVTSHPPEQNWRQTAYFRRLFEGAEQRARQLGFRLQEFSLPAVGNPMRLAEILRTRNVNGLILGPMPTPGTRLTFPWSEFAVAALGTTLEQPGLHRVRGNYFQVMTLTCTRLRERGYRRLGFVAREHMDRRGSRRWRAAFLLDQDLHGGIEPDAMKLVPGGELNRDVVEAWIRRYRPDAIITSRNAIYDWITDMGFSVPDDIALAYTGLGAQESFLSGVDQRLEAVGAHAVNLVVEQFHHNERGLHPDPKTVVLDGVWIDGKTAPRRSGNRKTTRTGPRNPGAKLSVPE